MIVQHASLVEKELGFGRILVGYLTALILVQFFLPQNHQHKNEVRICLKLNVSLH